MRSNWMAAVPKTSGEANRRRAWLRVKVMIRESSWRRTSDRAESSEVASSDGAARK